MVKLLKVLPQPGHRIYLEFDDGTSGDVDLGELVGKGVFAALKDPSVFDGVTIGEFGQIRWTDEVELCADAMYLKVSKKPVGELFPGLKASADA